MSLFDSVRFFILSPRGGTRLALILAGCVAAGLARADVKTKPEDKKKKMNPEQIIPEVRDRTVTFEVGKAVEIELVASTGTLKPVEFLIRQQPESGTLSAVRSHPRETNKGIVTYLHRGGDAPLADRFTFACRVDGGTISASAMVTLTGKKFEPKLELVDYKAVDKVFMGDEGVVRFAVKNNGAADFAADIPWEAPWEGPARIEVKAGETERYIVLFRPKTAGVYRLEKFLQTGVAGSRLPLYGQCVRPLTVTPGRLVLTKGSSGAREGELQLINGQSAPVRVQVQADGRLQGGGLIEVPGGGKSRVSLALPPTDVASYIGEVKITSTQGGEVVAVVADAKAAELRMVEPTGALLDLGSVPVGKAARGEVVIKNFGGTTAVIQAQVRAPLLVQPSGEAVRLEPGGQAVFVLTMTGDQTGPLTRDLTFSGDQTMPPVVVQMQVLPAETVSVSETVIPKVTQTGVPRESQPSTLTGGEAAERTLWQRLLLAQLASSGLPVMKDRINPFLGRVTTVDLLARNSNSVTIAWKVPSVMPASWIIEGATMVHVTEGGGSLVKVWVPLKNWKIVDAGPGRVAALIEPLPPAAQLELRIMGVDREEKISEPSAGFLVTTAEAWRVPAWVWRTLFIGLLAVAAYILNKMRLGEWEWKFRRASKPAGI